MAKILTSKSNLLALEGEIDLHESPKVREELLELLKNKPKRLYVDLGKLTYIDSSGIAVLIETLQQMQAYGGKLLIYGTQENVKQIFEIARLDKVFAMFPDKKAASAA